MKRGGGALFTYYPTMRKLLQAVYPTFSWEESKFVQAGKVVKSFWKKKSNLLAALKKVEEKMGIQKVNLNPSPPTHTHTHI